MASLCAVASRPSVQSADAGACLRREMREGGALQDTTERDRLVEHVRRHGGLAVGERQCQYFPQDEGKRHGERHVPVHLFDTRAQAARMGGPQPIGDGVELGFEHRLRGELRVCLPARDVGRRHADVVQVGQQDGTALHEPQAPGRSPCDQRTIELTGQPCRPPRRVAHMHRSVIRLQPDVTARVGDERVIGQQCLQRGGLLNRAPAPVPR